MFTFLRFNERENYLFQVSRSMKDLMQKKEETVGAFIESLVDGAFDPPDESHHRGDQRTVIPKKNSTVCQIFVEISCTSTFRSELPVVILWPVIRGEIISVFLSTPGLL